MLSKVGVLALVRIHREGKLVLLHEFARLSEPDGAPGAQFVRPTLSLSLLLVELLSSHELVLVLQIYLVELMMVRRREMLGA